MDEVASCAHHCNRYVHPVSENLLLVTCLHCLFAVAKLVLRGAFEGG